MHNYDQLYDLLKDKPAFAGIDREDFDTMMGCWSPRIQTFQPKEIIFRSNEDSGRFFLLASGTAHMFQEDFLGGRTLIKPKLAGELLNISLGEENQVGMQYMLEAVDECVVLGFDCNQILNCCKGCSFHMQFLVNLVRLLSTGHYYMYMHLMQVSRRTTREKLLAYFSSCAYKAKSATFTVPFTRQQMADYLCIDRSAMCTEMSNMQEAGFITYEGRQVTLHRMTNKAQQQVSAG